MPTQKLRRTGVRRKLNAITSEFKGKNVLLVDDSIVRGTTSREIVLMAREAGAKKVYFVSCAPPITYPHIYGIDLASSSSLIAFNKTHEDIAREIGADAVVYQSLEDLEKSCASLSPRPDQKFEVGVFCGTYITPVDPEYFKHLDTVRGKGDAMKKQDQARQAIVHGIASQEQLATVLDDAAFEIPGARKRRKSADDEEISSTEEKSVSFKNGHRERKGSSEVMGREETDNTEEANGSVNGENGYQGDVQDINLHNFADYDR